MALLNTNTQSGSSVTLIKKFLGLCWFALCIAFVWALMDLSKTYGGISYLVHVGAGLAATAAVACLAAAAVIGFGLFVRLAVHMPLNLAAGCLAGYVLAGVFSGLDWLQLLMPPMIGRPLVWAYLATDALALLTLTVWFMRSAGRG
jgi:hypothetical protein